MRIFAKDLVHHLQRTLLPLYMVAGEEPLQHQEAVEAIRTAAKNKGYTEREVFEITPSFNTEAFFANLKTPSLFAEKRIIECRLNDVKLNNKITDFFKQLTALTLDSQIILLISAPKIDKKAQQAHWFSSIEQKGCAIIVQPLSEKETLQWLKKRLNTAGLQATEAVVQLLFMRTEGNLLAGAQAIEKLSLLCADPRALTTEDIVQTVGMEARFTLYQLIDTALSGSISRTLQLFSSLKNEGIDPILLNWAICREVRTILLLMNTPTDVEPPTLWKTREPLVKAFMARFTVSKLQQILCQAQKIDEILKGRRSGNAWDALFEVCLNLAGAHYA